MDDSHRILNTLQKYGYLLGAFGLAAAVGSIWLGWNLTLALLGIGAAITLYSLRTAPEQLLRWQRAILLNRPQNPDLYQLVNSLAHRAGLTHAPQLYLVPSRIPNAFAMGSKDKPVIGISQGLVSVLDRRELQGVLAHEISHIKNNDLMVKGLARSFGKLTHTLSWIGRVMLFLAIPLTLLGFNLAGMLLSLLLLTLSPTLNLLLQMGLSRSMEFLADQDAGTITRDPMGLASALQRIEDMSKPWWVRMLTPVGYQTADWLRSHPNTQKRIARLAEQSRQYSAHQEHRVYEPQIISRPRTSWVGFH